MTPSQKKRLFEMISSQELDWRQFIEMPIDDNEGKIISKISHSPTGMYFQYTYSAIFENLEVGPWGIIHTPGKNLKPIDSHLGFIRTWKQVEYIFKDWLSLLKHEIVSQSFITQILSASIDLKDFSERNGSINQPFSEAEKVLIKTELESFKLSVSHDLASFGSEIDEINEKIDYLIDRLEKNFSKVDWTNIFISISLSTMLNEGLQIVKSPEFISLIKTLFHFLTRGQFLN